MEIPIYCPHMESTVSQFRVRKYRVAHMLSPNAKDRAGVPCPSMMPPAIYKMGAVYYSISIMILVAVSLMNSVKNSVN